MGIGGKSGIGVLHGLQTTTMHFEQSLTPQNSPQSVAIAALRTLLYASISSFDAFVSPAREPILLASSSSFDSIFANLSSREALSFFLSLDTG
jgi:hypothetical protein